MTLLVSVSVLLGGCSGFDYSDPWLREWTLHEWGPVGATAEVPLDDLPGPFVSISFDRWTHGEATGNDGCNHFTTAYEFDGGGFTFTMPPSLEPYSSDREGVWECTGISRDISEALLAAMDEGVVVTDMTVEGASGEMAWLWESANIEFRFRPNYPED